MKLKDNIYPSMDAFRADAILLYQNSIDFNGIDHTIASAALEARERFLKAINDIEGGENSMIL